jgi:hypothetical protein
MLSQGTAHLLKDGDVVAAARAVDGGQQTREATADHSHAAPRARGRCGQHSSVGIIFRWKWSVGGARLATLLCRSRPE